MQLTKEKYLDKVLACWTGKNIGGTVGFPMEFDRKKNIIEGYENNFKLPMPNDDLDIQLLWLIALEEMGNDISCERLGEYWQRYLTPNWAEYGISKVNMRAGVTPPMSGTFNNHLYKHSNGAWIRSEIWACIAPGQPQIAANFALCDAVIDHGNGEGTWGEVFCSALQSIAFVETDIRTAIKIALTYIPSESGLGKAINDAIKCYDKGMSLDETRDFMLTYHRGRYGRSVSQEDAEKGFADGKMGYDCPLNVSIVILGLLYGENSFDKTLKSTIFFGEDTDCTVGTALSTFGIMNGMDSIDEKWKAPIGTDITVGTLNLGELGTYGDALPQTVMELTDRIYNRHCILAKEKNLLSAEVGFSTEEISANDLCAPKNFVKDITRFINVQSFRCDFCSIYIDYLNENCTIVENEPREIKVTIKSEYKTADIINYRWLTPPGVTVSPAKSGRVFLMFKDFLDYGEKTLSFTFTATDIKPIERYVFELSIEGRTTVLYAPAVFILGSKEQE